MDVEIGMFVLTLKLQKLFCIQLLKENKNLIQAVVSSDCSSVFSLFIFTKYIQKWECFIYIYRWKRRSVVGRV